MPSSPNAGGPRPDSGGEPPRPVVPPILRVVLYLLLVTTLLGLGTGLALGAIAPEMVEAMRAGETVELSLGRALLVQVALLPLILLATSFFVARVDRRRLADLGVGLVPLTSLATLITMAVFAALPLLWLALAGATGGIRFAGWQASGASALTTRVALPLLYFTGFVLAAIGEEVILRGYVYSTLERRYRWINAAGASAALFAFLHLSNPAIGPIALLNTFLLGLLFAAIRRQTGSILPAAAGHAVWNAMLGCVLSQPISGIDAYPLLDLTLEGNDMVTGGTYGPEASILVTGLLVPLVFLVVLKTTEDDEEQALDTDPSD